MRLMYSIDVRCITYVVVDAPVVYVAVPSPTAAAAVPPVKRTAASTSAHH